MYTLDLLKYKIIGIDLRCGHFLDYLKFTLKDINSTTFAESPDLGGSGGSLFIISYKSITEVTRIFGTTTNQRNIRAIAFEYKTSNY